ncbi:MAG: N-acetylmuramoyl-L-alanine amidase [Candidatus Nomurabacteria bacterium]|nr:N-acetylmuramoyl-L-alanine amidase [Candidatus Nomurabacteria bacterium]
MTKFISTFLIAFICATLGVAPLSAIAKTGASKTQAEAIKPVRILIVPGHDDEVWGAQYKNMKEASMTLALGTQIYNLLKKDKRFEVYITRNGNGYTKDFADYFTNHMDEIKSFKQIAKTQMAGQLAAGLFVQKKNTPHASVKEIVADRLYGLNKWANENNIDAMIHIHFDDYPRPHAWTIGDYKGFAIYMPESQFPNAANSALLAGNIFAQLEKKYITSTYPEEKGGLIPDQKLIALGANDTLLPSTRSVLVEYGYIYQKIFRNSTTRHQAYKTMADLTVKGIINYFFPKK